MSILNVLCSCSGLYSQLLSVFFCLTVLSVPASSMSTSTQLTKDPEGSFADFCKQWVTYKDPQSGRCRPCSPCPEDHLEVAKCEFDRDTLCRPLTDLAEHIKSVVHSSSVMVTKKNDTVVILEENTVFQQAIGGIEYSPILVAVLALIVFGCVTYIVLQSFKRCRKHEHKKLHQDPLQESLLGQDEGQEEENEKPVLDMDEMLAQRFGRSLVTNVYVP